jgi:iron(III) transport system substrate-binding protein
MFSGRGLPAKAISLYDDRSTFGTGRPVMAKRAGIRLGWSLVLALIAAKPGSAAETVVVYTALDREFSEPVLEAYATRTGVRVLPKFDVESTKTVGLTNLIMVEGARPRCDLFWNNEILNTIRLKDKGLLAPFRPARADDLPETFRAKDGTWYGFAARARILIVNTRLVSERDRPRGIADLLDPKWKGKIGIAKPLFGTTATHAACLFARWGDEKARTFFKDLKANGVQVLSGNKQVAQAVGSGELAFGLTDTDDAMGEIDAGKPVAIVYPDREPGDLGTLFIPNTLAVIKGAPHLAAAEALADHLLRPEVEAELARGPSAQIPLLKSTTVRARVETPRTVHAMEVDFESAARIWDRVAAFLAAEFAGG